ncbi:bacillithiol biosynthesis cysteine-adding enzyme BshC [Dyadobacter psychrotolerans]|uniref:Putative cysteine ligase BshC n=1 Tax=Dyadobacter psychrotolerans TaxID=2541721 RepID=A0A4R5DKI6_9BACT|nr:bacillithiol biosynthesis cysteine-adding enzyme BshC [Dyadobacter psychrotolerans]TDE12484.1 bacillithiol biosynthesis cysteine-adding enzyme BshC [Dyadobacter psychrotolerans]
MTLKKVDLRNTGQFPALLLDYLDQKPGLAEFYSNYPAIENAAEVIRQKAGFDSGKRKTLVEVLEKQYHGSPFKPDFSVLLDSKTFTVTTGHQLNIFTGPLYIIYKIVTTIKLAQELKKAYPENNFVPVYWMATEDHDFEEIASFHLFGQTHKWEGEHRGAVGRLDPKELESILKHLPVKPLLFAKAYLENRTLADAVRCYMHELFGQDGLVCLDADHPDLKRHFLPVIQEELTTSTSEKLVAETTSKLAALGYHTPLTAREINLFYLQGNLRERIVREGDRFNVLNTGLSFSEEEILALTEEHPEYFSPNVVLRPLYEEIILPNLAYIGGPSEVPYWMQLKGVFDHYQVPFPMLVPRNFALYINDAQRKKAEKLRINYDDLFLDQVALRRVFVEKNTEKVLSLDEQKSAFEQVFSGILEKAVAVDKTMEGAVKAEQARLINSLENLEKRIRRAEERNHESEIDQLLNLQNKLFPNGTAQERYDNLLSFYVNDSSFIRKFFDAFDPLDFKYNILIDDNRD